MNAAVTLRPARALDAGAVGGILSSFIDDTDWMPRIHTRAEDIGFAGIMIDKGWTTVAISGGRVAGFITRRGTEVLALYLAPWAQRQGIGARLLAAAKSEADRLTLWCFEANETARAFYGAQGFREAGRSDGTRNDEGLPDIRFTWHGDADG
ncbi:hypothetical protein ATO6_16085 [Oceanicola sp. 22II-s10i]|uniref:GNAT family N-acetyltransferase n=1 Tax=Oceanicola sp. 22II-s10i TaxID=1317116 RepID=UPI000B765EB8|nr:GNAT family N-acetyltransferase [Oceanicola sp. 22II-s10i]OWU83930.1 hypothetical protein ATO6_16085 [Oceanicola sp. 22II-s10i]